MSAETTISPGDQVRCIRNNCSAGKPEQDMIHSVTSIYKRLEPGDIIVVDRIIGSKIYYLVKYINKTIYHYIYIADVELVGNDIKVESNDCICPRDVWLYQGCKCGAFQREQEHGNKST
jgi:hypothetical protein